VAETEHGDRVRDTEWPHGPEASGEPWADQRGPSKCVLCWGKFWGTLACSPESRLAWQAGADVWGVPEVLQARTWSRRSNRKR
jgi:hypothetical protein